MTAEPFALTSPCSWDSDRRTRIMLFAVDLGLQPGENLSLVTADAEDAAHRHYDLTVEYIGPVAQDWISAIVLRLNDNLGDVGDVLVRVSYRGINSNRVRLAIGHSGGGPPDDVGAIPTPIVGYAVRGQVLGASGEALDGVEVTLTNTSDGSKRTTVTRNGGKYLFTNVRPGFNYTVMPAITSLFLFSPQSVEMLDGNRELNFLGSRTYSIRGRLTDPSGAGVGAALMILNGAQNTTAVADSEGYYWLGGLVPGNYTMTVDSPYCSFPSTTISNLNGNELINLSGNLRQYTLAGRAQLGPYPANDIEITISGSLTRSTRTDGEGKFSFSGLPARGNYTIAPSAQYHDFFPVTETVTDLHSDILTYYFIGTRQAFAISGTISDQEGHGLSGIAMNLTGAEERTTITDSGGHYQFAGLPAGYGYVVTPPSTPSYTFTARSVAVLSSNQTLDFTGLRRLQLNGRVLDQSGNGIIGIRVSLTGSESAASLTSADGSYSLTATATGNYTVTPSIPQDYYTFAPATAQFNNLAVGHTTNFSATLAPLPNPAYVLEFDSHPKTVDYGNFWQENVNLGHFFWEFWAMPGVGAGATYLVSDGYGGSHALLFGVGSFNSSEPSRYELLGNIFDGVTFNNYFGGDVGPAMGEWGHLAVGWDGQNLITYFNGVPVGKVPFAGPRRTPGPGNGGGRLLIGGSDHSNFDGRIAQVRGYEDTNPRELGGVEASFAPETVFSLQGNLLSYYFRPGGALVADLSQGYRGVNHAGSPRGTTLGVLDDCGACPPPQFVIDPTAPNFVANAGPNPVNVPPPLVPPDGALVFDSFSRANSTYVFAGHGGLGALESSTTGPQTWQTNASVASLQPFGILNSRAVLLANSRSVAWVNTGSASGNISVRVNRYAGRWGSGKHTGLSFRVLDANNFFFAYTSGTGESADPTIVHLGYYLNGNRVDLATGATLGSDWTTLRVDTTTSGDVKVYVDDGIVISTNTTLLASAGGAGIFNNSPGLALTNRWDNFTVFELGPRASRQQ